MVFEIKVPEVGESITEGVIAEWLVSDGDVVESGEDIYVLETDKITTNVPAEKAGRISIKVSGGETVEIGQTVATVDTDASAADAGGAKDEPDQQGAEPSDAAGADTGDDGADTSGNGKPDKTAASPDLSDLSPAVRRLVAEHDLDPADIEGTGRGGRLTKEDVVRHLDAGEKGHRAAGESSAAQPETERTPPAATGKAQETKPADVERFPKPRPSSAPPAGTAPSGERESREPMSRLRMRIAERLVEVQQTAAILTTFNEADMSRVMALRSEFKEPFKQRHGIGLGFMSFFVKASVDALTTVPQVNSFIDGPDMVRNNYYDIGVAVSTDRGLVVPVVRDADRKSMARLEAEISDLATRAHERRLELTDLQGAVFTVSNGGIFGSMMSTPILNPPGSAILGMHAIQKRPVVVADEIVIRPMMYLALSYDHRVIDGREAVTFLKRIKECIENPERMLLEV